MNSILTQGSIFSTIIFLLSKPSRVWSCCSNRYDEFPWSFRRKLLPFLNRQRLKNTFLLPFHYFLFDERWRNRLTSFSFTSYAADKPAPIRKDLTIKVARCVQEEHVLFLVMKLYSQNNTFLRRSPNYLGLTYLGRFRSHFTGTNKTNLFNSKKHLF